MSNQSSWIREDYWGFGMHAGLCQHATVCLMFKISAYNPQLSRNVVLIFRGDDALYLAKYVVFYKT